MWAFAVTLCPAANEMSVCSATVRLPRRRDPSTLRCQAAATHQVRHQGTVSTARLPDAVASELRPSSFIFEFISKNVLNFVIDMGIIVTVLYNRFHMNFYVKTI